MHQCLAIFQEQIANKLTEMSTSRVLVYKDAKIPTNQLQSYQLVDKGLPLNNQKTLESGDHLRGPRQLAKRTIMDFCFGCFFSNVVNAVIDRIWPNPAFKELEEREHVLAHKINELNSRANLTSLQIRAISESSQLTAQLVQHNVEKVHAIQVTFPLLAVVTANMVARMHLLGSYLDKIRVSFRMRRPDIEILSLVYGYEELLDVDPDSIVQESVKLSSPRPNELVVEFVGRRRLTTTQVYQVAAIP